jgi:hypothetical protein
VFWEREPFVWDDEGGRVSRFVNLGSFGGPLVGGKKQRVWSLFLSQHSPHSLYFIGKWFYAFSMTPDAPQLKAQTPRPTNATKNPYTEAAPRPSKRPLESGEPENFIFGNVRQPGKRNRLGASISRFVNDYA